MIPVRLRQRIERLEAQHAEQPPFDIALAILAVRRRQSAPPPPMTRAELEPWAEVRGLAGDIARARLRAGMWQGSPAEAWRAEQRMLAAAQ